MKHLIVVGATQHCRMRRCGAGGHLEDCHRCAGHVRQLCCTHLHKHVNPGCSHPSLVPTPCWHHMIHVQMLRSCVATATAMLMIAVPARA